VALGHNTQAGQALLSWPTAEAFGRPRWPGAARALPTRAHREWARPERCCGEMAGGSSMAGTQRGLRQNHLRGSAFLPLHQNRRGETWKGVLTGGVLGMVENGGIDEGTSAKTGRNSWARSFSCKGRRCT
jgi:hypothetical protein